MRRKISLAEGSCPMSAGPGSVAPTTRSGEAMTAVNEFEGALARAEADVEAAIRAEGAWTRERKRGRAALTIGQVRDLRRCLGAAAQQAEVLREAVCTTRGSYDV